MSVSKTRPVTIDQYIAAFSKEVQEILEELRRVVKSVAPEAQETISYGIPTFKLHGNLVHFAAYKTHIGFYPGGPSAVEAFDEELSQYNTSKGTIQFPIGSHIPFQLIRKIVEFRVQENESKKNQ